jgi:hypothetical protein
MNQSSKDEHSPKIGPPPVASDNDVEPVLEVPEIDRVEGEMPGGFKAAGGLADHIRPPKFHLPGHEPNDS